MFGIVIGTLCLFGFIAVWRRRHGWGWHRYGHGCGDYAGGPGGGGRYGGRAGWRGRFGLYRVFEELDTSPGQEKAIRGALGELRAALAALRPQLADARQSLVDAFGSEPFDTAALQRSLQGRLDEAAGVSPALAQAAAKIHEALDADQRRRLARLIDSMPYGHVC